MSKWEPSFGAKIGTSFWVQIGNQFLGPNWEPVFGSRFDLKNWFAGTRFLGFQDAQFGDSSGPKIGRFGPHEAAVRSARDGL